MLQVEQFFRQNRMLLRHCCWCGQGLRRQNSCDQLIIVMLLYADRSSEEDGNTTGKVRSEETTDAGVIAHITTTDVPPKRKYKVLPFYRAVYAVVVCLVG